MEIDRNPKLPINLFGELYKWADIEIVSRTSYNQIVYNHNLKQFTTYRISMKQENKFEQPLSI